MAGCGDADRSLVAVNLDGGFVLLGVVVGHCSLALAVVAPLLVDAEQECHPFHL